MKLPTKAYLVDVILVLLFLLGIIIHTKAQALTANDLITLSKHTDETVILQTMESKGYSFLKREGHPIALIFQGEQAFAVQENPSLQFKDRYQISMKADRNELTFSTVLAQQNARFKEEIQSSDLAFKLIGVQAHSFMEGEVAAYISNKYPEILIKINELRKYNYIVNESSENWKSYDIQIIRTKLK